MFEKATRLKLRFDYRGQISTEDLWDLSVEQLDAIYKSLNARVKASKEESLLEKKSTEDSMVDLQVAIVKHIVEVKLQEAAERKNLRARLSEKQKLLGILAEKQDAALQSLSVEDLQKRIDELG